MKSSVLSILFCTAILTSGCAMSPVKPDNKVVVGSGTMYAKWQKAILDECSDKAAEVVLKLTADKYREGILLTEEQIVMIHGMLVKKCSMNSGIVI
jgi:hypothetical protein